MRDHPGSINFPQIGRQNAQLVTVFGTTRQIGKSKPELDLFVEMRALSNNDKSVSPETILQMVTINGARALGFAGTLGELSEGALADMIAIPFSEKISQIHESVLSHAGNVRVSMIEGRWAIPPGQ